MLNKKIIFCAINKDLADVWPHPQPAKLFVPPEYKNLERFESGNMHKPSIKTCIPFLDSMTAGYIIPFDQDYLVDPVENDFSVTPANKEKHDFGFHNKTQLPKEWHKITGENAGKFHNKWLIKTPPGYSCLFIHPMNRYGEERWKIIEGIVDTDTYINVINFPFILKKRDNQFLIKKGEPMVQIIPFKRESWKSWSGFYLEKAHSKTVNLLNSEWINRYKNMFWKKKNWK
jgi:hypothetical protein|tara:strand:- start:2039 stop:2728 length:690 start_codon:yes stop_codon:yes gene_type:complete